MSEKQSSEKEYYWGEMSQEEAQEFLVDARKQGYRVAVAKMAKKIPGFYEYVLSFLRADWLYDSINLKNNKSALDVGSGWGAIAFSLANTFEKVYSLEAISERLEFQKIRAKQEKIKNIEFIKSDWLKLPFPDNTFDLVSCNGILEWIGLSDFEKSPRKLQIEFLKEVKRVLKPNGVVYIGIENRYAGFLFLGAQDHSGLPFTSLMSRNLADWVTRNFRKTGGQYDQEKRMEKEWPDYRTYTYSYSGYQKLLKKAGFDKTDIHWSIAYNSPSDAGPVDSQSFSFLLKLFSNHDFNTTFLSKMATVFGAYIPGKLSHIIIKLLSPSFLIFSSKKLTTSFSDELVTKTKAESFLRRSGTHGLNSKINYFLLRDGEPFKIAKFARYEKYVKCLRSEEELLSKWSGIKVDEKKIQGKTVFFEDYIDGRVCQTLSNEDNKTTVGWLVHFQKSTAKGNWTKSSFSKLTKNNLSFIKSNNLLSTESFSDLSRSLDEVISSPEIKNIPQTYSHGDFVKTNILFDREERMFVIDWEFYQENFYPLFDFLFFLINNSIIGNLQESFKDNWTGNSEYSSIIKSQTEYYSRELNLNKQFILKNIPWVLSYALSRRVSDSYFKHLDLDTYIALIKYWNEISGESEAWLLSDD